jgi:hypothetical protein
MLLQKVRLMILLIACFDFSQIAVADMWHGACHRPHIELELPGFGNC